jgi:peroxiredoxin
MCTVTAKAILAVSAVAAGSYIGDSAGRAEAPSPAKQLEQLKEEYDRAVDGFENALPRAGSRADRDRLRAALWDQGHKFARRALALAAANPDGDVGLEALAWILEEAPAASPSEDAVRILLSRHLKDAGTAQLARRLVVRTPSPGAEKLLRALAVRKQGPGAGSAGQLRLAIFLARKADLVRSLRADQGRGRLQENYEPVITRWLLQADAEQLTKEVDQLLRGVTVGREPDEARGRVAEQARMLAFEVHHLAVGKVAPEIDGIDADGRRMRLSEYRGKAVVLKFWGTWCGPCMGMVPHDRALVKRLEGRPFVLLGVECDDDRAQARRLSRAKGINWRSWWDGGSRGGPIAQDWNVSGLWGWPTIYILDARGVIRYKDVRGPAMEDAVEVVVREAQRAGPGK